MNNRTYKEFTPHENHVDTIEAGDINELQRAIEKNQQELFAQADATFLTKALFALEHHPDVNSLKVNLLEDSSQLDSSKSVSLSFHEETKSIGFESESAREGTVTTQVIVNETGKPYKKLILLVDEHKPAGSVIEYYISFDDVDYLQIEANQAVPAYTSDELAQLYVKIRMVREDTGIEPRVDAWALLYQDETYAFRFLDNGLDIGIESDWDGTIVR